MNMFAYPLRCALCVVFFAFGASALAAEDSSGRWSVERANAWYAEHPWPAGFNYAPRYAVNQIEMWQADTFDPAMIDEELGWAARIGFNMVRVFLHDLLWQQDAPGFTARVDEFLTIADRHGMTTMLVLFDDVWNPEPKLGTQPEPRPGVHNSGWVQGPGSAILGDLNRHDELEPYVRGIVSRFGDDPRVAIWDLYNEPGNDNILSYRSTELDDKYPHSLALLEKVFTWVRDEDPEQPLTAAVWRLWADEWQGADPEHDAAPLFNFMLDNSDIITFHSYQNRDNTAAGISYLETLQRPMICTEYMARGHDSTFETVMPLFAEKNIGAIHWGFVSGKSQTIYPWSSWIGIARWWNGLFSDEPEPWHHDLLHADGSAYNEDEIAFVSALIARKNGTNKPTTNQ